MFRKLLLASGLFLLGCGVKELPTGPGGTEAIDPTSTFTRVQNEVFTPHCASLGCHDPLGRQQGLILSPGRAYAATVGIPSTEMSSVSLVDAGRINMSYLYRKIIGSGITGDRMPQGGPPLNDAQTKLVRDWIRRGAPND